MYVNKKTGEAWIQQNDKIFGKKVIMDSFKDQPELNTFEISTYRFGQ